MQPSVHQHYLQAADAAAMQQALADKGISWDGENKHLLAEVNGQQVEMIFIDPWPQEVDEEGQPIDAPTGYHANAVSRGNVPFDFGALEIEVTTPKVRWAGVGGNDVE